MNCAACVLLLLTLAQLRDPPPRFERLPNGLRMAIVEDHGLPLVSVQLWCRVGSAFDPPSRPGLCHVTRTVLEHRDDAALKLRAAGVRFESETLRDACYFSSLLPPNFLEYVLKIEAARMRPVSVDGGMIEPALGAAARDCGLYPDDPEHAAERPLLAALFPDHPYQHPPGFVAESLKDLKPIDVQEFFDRWFVPGNVTLFIIGDVSTPAALELVRKHFGPLEWAEPPRRAEAKSPETGTVRVPTVTPDRSGFDIAWLTPPAGYYENAAIDVLMQRLCNPVDGPLRKRLLELGCPPPRWRHEAWRDAGMLVLSIDLPLGPQGRKAPRREGGAPAEPIPSDAGEGEAPAEPGVAGGLPTRASVELDDLERIVREELSKAAETIPTEIEHNRARALAARDARNRRAAFGDRARILAAHEILAGDLLIADFELPRLRRVAVPAVQQAALVLRAARTIFAQRHIEPMQATRTAAAPTAQSGLLRPLPAEPAKCLGGDEALNLLAGYASGTPKTSVSACRPKMAAKWSDTVGGYVCICPLPTTESATVSTAVYSDPTWPAIMAAVLATGSAQHGPEQLRGYLSYHSIRLAAFDEVPWRGLSATGPTSRVLQMVELEAELLRRPKLDRDSLANARQRLADSRLRPRANAAAFADALAREATMQMRMPSTDQLESLLRQIAAEREPARKTVGERSYARFPFEGLMEITIVGNVDPQEVFAAVEETWARFASLEPPKRGPERQQQWPPASVKIVNGEPVEIAQILWAPGTPARVEVRLLLDASLRLGLSLPDASSLQTWTWRFGPPTEHMRTLSAQHVWRWRATANFNGPFDVMIATMVAPDGLTVELRRLLAYVASMPIGLPPEKGALLRRLGTASQLTTSDGTEQIAELIRRRLCPCDPPLWAFAVCGSGMRNSVPAAQAVLVAVGGDDSVGTALEQFGPVTIIDPNY